MSFSDFDVRMKEYERRYLHRTMPLLPVVVRLDGKAFHTWCKGLEKPFERLK